MFTWKSNGKMFLSLGGEWGVGRRGKLAFDRTMLYSVAFGLIASGAGDEGERKLPLQENQENRVTSNKGQGQNPFEHQPL